MQTKHNKRKLPEGKVSKVIFATFVMTIISLFCGVAVSAATYASSMDSEVYDRISVKKAYWDITRWIGYNLIKQICKLIDVFQDAIDTLLSINLYDLIKDQFNIESNIYAIAGAVAGVGIVFATILLFMRFDKMQISDYLRNIIISMLLIVALPAIISAATDLKTYGVDAAEDQFDTSDYEIIDDEGITYSKTIGQSLLGNFIYDMEESITSGELVAENDDDTNDPYSISINEVLDEDEFDKKPKNRSSSTTTSANLQKKYSELEFIDKLQLLSDAGGGYTYNRKSEPYTTQASTSLVETYQQFYGDDATDDGFLLANACYDKSTGSLLSCRIYVTDINSDVELDKSSNTENNTEIGYFVQEARGDGQYLTTAGALTRITKEEYDNYDGDGHAFSIQVHDINRFLNYELADLLSSNGIFSNNAVDLYSSRKVPSSVWNENFDFDWVRENIINAKTLTSAISALESITFVDETLGNVNIIEYLNVAANYQINQEAIEDDDINVNDATFTYLENLDIDEASGYNNLDRFYASILTNDDSGFASSIATWWFTVINDGTTEHLYAYSMDFFVCGATCICVLLCLIFAGLKIASLMFDVLFAQIIAPIVLATDFHGAGRAKQVINNLISCSLCFIVIVFLVRMYIAVVAVVTHNGYNLLVILFVIIGGCKFTIDGPDLIVKLTGMDAGVKSGAAAIMSVRSGMQMASGAAKAAGNVAKTGTNAAAGGVAGAISGAKAGASNASTPLGKAAAAITGGAGGAVGGAVSGGSKTDFGRPKTLGQAVSNAKHTGEKVGGKTGKIGGTAGDKTQNTAVGAVAGGVAGAKATDGNAIDKAGGALKGAKAGANAANASEGSKDNSSGGGDNSSGGTAKTPDAKGNSGSEGSQGGGSNGGAGGTDGTAQAPDAKDTSGGEGSSQDSSSSGGASQDSSSSSGDGGSEGAAQTPTSSGGDVGLSDSSADSSGQDTDGTAQAPSSDGDSSNADGSSNDTKEAPTSGSSSGDSSSDASSSGKQTTRSKAMKAAEAGAKAATYKKPEMSREQKRTLKAADRKVKQANKDSERTVTTTNNDGQIETKKHLTRFGANFQKAVNSGKEQGNIQTESSQTKQDRKLENAQKILDGELMPNDDSFLDKM